MLDSFRLNTKEIEGVVIVQTDGYIDNSAGDEIAELCLDLISKNKKNILFDFGKSKVINSVGVSVFIEVIEKLQAVQGSIGFFNLIPIVKKTFEIMGITKYSKIYEDEKSAVEAMGKR